MGRLYNKLFRALLVVCGVCALWQFAPSASASPFGEGVFGAHVPFGSLTSLSIALGGDVSLSLTPSGPNLSGSGSHTITVTSTDVVGYGLYIYATGGTNLTSSSATIPASANGSPAPLSTNTWGFNTDASSNYQGITTVPSLIKTGTGPFETGDNTTVTYGVLTDSAQAADDYTVTVTYTVVALND
jgi:hypothetical protein